MKNNFLHYKHEFFTSLDTCKNFLIEEKLVKKNGVCDKCSSVTELMKYSENNNERVVYRCRKTGCQSKKKFFKGNRLPFDEFLFLVYLILLKEDYDQIKHLYHVSNTKIASVKNTLRLYFETRNKEGLLIGGLGVKVEVDETVLCRRGIIRNPSSADDHIKDTVWILGIIDTSNKENIYVKRVENRSAYTITRALEGKIGVGSILASAGGLAILRL
ncbi:hypothetical protein NGRA_0276 [Nosema granulosis]|uniref:Transposase n=1 Tax=Nosema granulosis TaxID=83296 RepID=A0A9P6H0L4_9MICR|nr:hypothetical protein NGRA_0276 [Nosema granulosis]